MLSAFLVFLSLLLFITDNDMLDSSCGDMTWMPSFLHSRTDVEYTGYDLLPVNIEHAKEAFKNESWTFSTFDLVKDKIGIQIDNVITVLTQRVLEKQFDIIICRHTAIHLGLHDNIQVWHLS